MTLSHRFTPDGEGLYCTCGLPLDNWRHSDARLWVLRTRLTEGVISTVGPFAHRKDGEAWATRHKVTTFTMIPLTHPEEEG